MICPKCKAEYRSGFRKCEVCQIELVEASRTSGTRKKKSVAERRTLRQDAYLGMVVLFVILITFLLGLKLGNRGANLLDTIRFMFIRSSFLLTVAASAGVGCAGHLLSRKTMPKRQFERTLAVVILGNLILLLAFVYWIRGFPV